MRSSKLRTHFIMSTTTHSMNVYSSTVRIPIIRLYGVDLENKNLQFQTLFGAFTNTFLCKRVTVNGIYRRTKKKLGSSFVGILLHN